MKRPYNSSIQQVCVKFCISLAQQARSLADALLPPANEVCEGYVFTGVCLHRGGGLHPGGRADPPPIQTPTPTLQVLWDTVKERAVRILLECILVHDVIVTRTITPNNSNISSIVTLYFFLIYYLVHRIYYYQQFPFVLFSF